jgi:hypothetical protein
VGTASEEEKHAILLIFNNYLEGRPINDVERLRAPSHPDAYIRTNIEGELFQWTPPRYLQLVAQTDIQECEP